MKLSLIENKLTDEKLWDSSVPFDTIIEGKKGRRVKYTHGHRENEKYIPKFLTYVKKECQDFYIIGSRNAKKWLLTGKI